MAFGRPYFAKMALLDRRRWAARRHFKCECIACNNDYPLLKDMKRSGAFDIATAFSGAGRESKTYQRVCDILQRFNSHYPCVEIEEGHEILFFCIWFLANPSKIPLLWKPLFKLVQSGAVDACSIFRESVKGQYRHL